MGEESHSKTVIGACGEKKSYEKGSLSFVNEEREVKILWTTEIILGREQVCDIRLANNAISRKHAVVQLDYSGAKFVDLMSSNGSTRNGEPVQGTIMLNDGDRLMLGGAIPIVVKLREEGDSVKSVLLKLGQTEYLLTQNDVLIGRHPTATDITVNDPLMSSIHAQLEFLFDGAMLSCLDDEKPIIVDGHPIKSLQLKSLSAIQIGSTKFSWRC